MKTKGKLGWAEEGEGWRERKRGRDVGFISFYEEQEKN